ncbi:MAG: DUF4296 domain-containing protein [Prevotella sp.]|nr:DUF4296 domain-containing protein [Prevotella sp.]
MKKSKIFFLFCLCGVLLFSCKPKVPRKYIQPNKLEDILYDYHIATAMAQEQDDSRNETFDTYLYREAVLKKYKITQAELDSSLVYYMRHGERLNKIYERVSQRLSASALALGASESEISRYGDLSQTGDTANIWTLATSTVLTPEAPYNVMSFSLEADSTFYEGDKFILSFSSCFLSRSNNKMATAMLVLDLDNDSTINSSQTIPTNRVTSLSLQDNKHKGIKRVRGFIYLNKERDNSPEGNSVHILFVKDIHLIKMHEAKDKDEQAQEDDNTLKPQRGDMVHDSKKEEILRDSFSRDSLLENAPKPSNDFSKPNDDKPKTFSKEKQERNFGGGDARGGTSSQKTLPQEATPRLITRRPQNR